MGEISRTVDVMEMRSNAGGRVGERGFAIVVSLVIMLILTLLGSGLLMMSDGATRAATGLNEQTNAFEVADGGIELARQRVMICLNGNDAVPPCNVPRTPSGLLAAVANGGALVNPLSLAAPPNGFGTTSGTTNATGNLPIVASNSAALPPSAFQVFLTNDTVDGPQNVTDTNYILMLTSFGSGPNGIGFAAIQTNLAIRSKLPRIPTLPGTLVMPGPNVSVSMANSYVFNVDNTASGACEPTIAVTSPTSLLTIAASNLGIKRPLGYTTCNPVGGPNLSGVSTVSNFIDDSGANLGNNPYGHFANSPTPFSSGDPTLASVAYLNGLVAGIRANADYAGPGTGNINLGTVSSPEIVVIDGDFTMSGNTTGAGILVVTGTLTWNGTPDYAGQILTIGAGSMVVNGGGKGGITFGGLLIANTRSPWTQNSNYVGIPSLTFKGGGDATWGYDKNQQNGVTAKPFLVPDRMGFRQLPS
jgi:Tfp pilus assembly protein PilX